MSNVNDILDKNRMFSGWYYDDQQNPFNVSRLTTVSLHANATYIPKITDRGYKYSDWSYDDPDLTDEETFEHYPFGNIERDNEAFKDYSSRSELERMHGQAGYFMEPLCTSIINEDFLVSINNSWSEKGGDMIGGLWSNVQEYAPYAGIIAENLGDIFSMLGDTVESKGKEGKGLMNDILTTVGGTVKTVGNLAKNPETKVTIDDYMNRSLVMQGTRFSYYQGSSVNFGNLVMKFTIFPKWKMDKNGKLKFYTVPAQITELYPYFMGEYKDEDKAEYAHDGLEEFIGWQLPPGGFRAAIQDIDNVQKGTLKLKVGTLYSVSNLVVESCQFNFSKQVCKCPDPEYIESKDYLTGKVTKDVLGLISPLYCEITLSLKPVTKYSSQSLKDFISGANMRYSRKMTIDTMTDNLTAGLDQLKERYTTDEVWELERNEDKKSAAAVQEALNGLPKISLAVNRTPLPSEVAESNETLKNLINERGDRLVDVKSTSKQ